MVPISVLSSSQHQYRLPYRISSVYDFGSEVNRAFVKRKMAEVWEQDVVKRSTGAFIKTLVYFGVMEEKDRCVQQKRLPLDTEQAHIILLLWARNNMQSADCVE